MRRLIALTLAAALTLTACDDGPKQGYVEDTWHDVTYVPTCYAYNSNGACTLSMPIPVDSWKLLLREPGQKPGWRDVASDTYLRCRFGSHYPDCKHRARQVGNDT